MFRRSVTSGSGGQPDPQRGRVVAQEGEHTPNSASGNRPGFLGEALPGSEPLEEGQDLAAAMVSGIGSFLESELARADAALAPGAWTEADISARRGALARSIGVVDNRLPVSALELVGNTLAPALLARTARWEAWAARWPVLPGVEGEGLWLRPVAPPAAHVVVLPDADQAPEALAGLTADIPPSGQIAARLADAGCEVLIPVLVDRGPTWAGGHPRREYVWRMAFEVGRHIIGYEVQRVLALVDHLTAAATDGQPVALYGYGEGGLVALHAAALDRRIAAVVVSGHFRDRREIWREPLYRDVWGLLRAGLGDAGLAALVAPRPLLVEAVSGPVVRGLPSGVPHPGVILSAGTLEPARPELVRHEVERARTAYDRHGAADRLELLEPGPLAEGSAPGQAGGVEALLRVLGLPPHGTPARGCLDRLSPGPEPRARQERQMRQLCDFTQGLLRRSRAVRDTAWQVADRSSPEAWARSCQPFRERFEADVIGCLPEPDVPPRPRSRLVWDRPDWRGYEVLLDVWPGVFASGLLLLPTDIQPGERRPVVVCQHGLEGRARDTVEGPPHGPYRNFARRLAERGYITYAPQNPYVGDEAFRVLQRKSHPLGASLFSVIVAQHRRTLAWLSGLPCVDAARVAFYGLSYGGKAAMRVPALLSGYCLSICSADFNEWAMKCASEDEPQLSYLFGSEYDMYEFDLAHTCNYAEMAGLIAPRPFMVERGHRDGVGTDEWVAFEYARVARLYDELGIGERTELATFVGGHWIDGRASFAFLERHLGDPRGVRRGAQRGGDDGRQRP